MTNNLKIYNSKTRTVDDFYVNEEGKVNMYTCGPTVYHFAHIGNLRTYIMEDLLERTLRYLGYDVKRCMNITDVGHLASDADTGEDKMLKGAKRENKSVMDIAKYYTDAFFADAKELNIKKPEIVAPATGEIAEFIKVIEGLLDKGYAYKSGGNIYFDTSKLKDYYVFNDFNEEDLNEGVREGVEADQSKRNKTDFVLWFTKSKFEDQALKWDSPFGVGYPGWHIECSCISMKYLGERLDIHCGGIDNAFPHHTNEIAQSEAYLGHPWCNFWFHVHHLNTEGGKMSKSKGEFLTLSLLKERGYDPMEYRYFCLLSHYRKNLEFSYANLDNAKASYQKLVSRIARLEDEGQLDCDGFEKFNNNFIEAISNDLNSANGISVLYEVLKSDLNGKTKLELINKFDEVLALNLNIAKNEKIEDDLPSEILELIEKRNQAKKDKDYKMADEIRDAIKEKGYILLDSKEGTTAKKI